MNERNNITENARLVRAFSASAWLERLCMATRERDGTRSSGLVQRSTCAVGGEDEDDGHGFVRGVA